MKVEVITRVSDHGTAPKKEEEALPSEGIGIIDLAHDIGAAAEFVEKGEVTESDAAKDVMENDGAPEEGVQDLPDGGVITDPAEVSHKVGKPVNICGDADMNLNMAAVVIFTELEILLSKNVDTEDFWDKSKNVKMSDKVLARVKGSALGFCWNITDNMLNFALVVDIVTKKHEELNKIKDNLVAKRLINGMAGPVCQNQAGVPVPLYKFIGSAGDPAAVGVPELPDVEI
jgi:hypothetical protein